jgi:triacylglycerol lipase
MRLVTMPRAAFVLGLALLSACSSDESPDLEDDAGFVTTGVGGNSDGAGTPGPSTGPWGHNDGGAGGGAPAPVGPFPIVLAHGFFGFEEFAGADFATYFYGVKAALADDGESEVFTPAVDPFNSSAVRGAQLEAHIEAILEETGAERVVIIGHSQGGLDARVVAHDRPDLVAAVLTVATPHGGSPIADVALGITDDPNASGLIDDLVNAIGAPLYDQVGDETSVTLALHQFSTPGIADFNAAYPDAPGVFYASITGRTANSFGGQACAADFHLPLVDEWEDERDPTEPLFWISEGLISNGSNIVNDGLVPAESGRHGEFWGCVPADHMDEIGQLFGDTPGFGNPFDHKALFIALVRELRLRGY